MTSRYTLRAVLLASTCLLPMVAHAQEDFSVGEAVPAKKAEPVYNNEATLGFRYQSADSAWFGRYNGTPFNGFGAVGSFRIKSRDAWDSGGTEYFQAEGNGLGFDSDQFMPNASVSVKYGRQGQWGLNAYYEGIPYWQSLTFHSLEDSSGQLKGLTPRSLPLNSGVTYTALTTSPTTGAITGGGATAAQLAAGTAALNSAYRTLNAFNSTQAVGTQRDIVGGSASYSAFGNWTFTAGLQHEHKQGTKENSFVTNGVTNINYFPEPVDYDTDRYTASARYNTKRLQTVFSYNYSKFTDNLDSFTTLNPFNIPSTALAPGYLATIYSLPPSNDAHQLKGQVAYNLTPTTRFNANLGYELMQQTSADPRAYLGAPASPDLRANNYSATVQHLFGNVAMTARPLANTDMRASYTVDDRINDSSRVFVPNRPNALITADTSGSNHVPIANLPVSQLNQTVSIEGGYRVIPSTKVSVNYTYADRQRDFSVTDRNHESTFGARVNSSLLTGLDGSLSYSHAVRTASAYYWNAAWLASTYPLTNRPGTGLFYLAARTRDEIKGTLNWGVSEEISAGLTGRFYNDHYPDSLFGVTNDHTLEIGPDIAYSPAKYLTTHFFYTFEEVFTGQKFSTSNSATAAQTNWDLRNKDTIHTVGAKADWQVNDDLKVGVEDNLSYGNTAFNEGYALIASSTGAPQPQLPTNIVGALPDDKTIINAVVVNGEYKLLSNISVLAQYAFERGIAKDYLYGQAAGSASNGPNVLSLGGDGNPSYSIHVISAAVRMKW